MVNTIPTTTDQQNVKQSKIKPVQFAILRNLRAFGRIKRAGWMSNIKVAKTKANSISITHKIEFGINSFSPIH